MPMQPQGAFLVRFERSFQQVLQLNDLTANRRIAKRLANLQAAPHGPPAKT